MNHEIYMQRCFDLAQMGQGRVAPNPMVGSVIVANGKVIGEGFHQQYGGAHAEVNAFASVQPKDEHLLREATIYVNLEPCNHFGKTPPCSHLIVQKGVKRGVICNVDSNPLVGGSGIQHLKENGIEVLTGVLEEQGRALNRRFFTFMEKKRPYVILKFAQTLDGFFAKQSNEQTWITTELSKQLVHKWRSEEQAILVGTTTVLTDNPTLNNRYYEEDKQPIRILLDEFCEVEKQTNILQGSQPTLVINSCVSKIEGNTTYINISFDESLLPNLLKELYDQNIQSVIIEGGAFTLQQFLNQNLWDEARVLTGNVYFKEGIKAPTVNGKIVSKQQIGEDKLVQFENLKI